MTLICEYSLAGDSTADVSVCMLQVESLLG